jgi:type I restriction enzyme R subunit
MNEAETRAEHIDPALKAAGWGVADGSRILREYAITLGRLEGYGKRGKTDKADYVLVFRNHKLAVVEAKAWNEDLTEGVGQAKKYAEKMNIRFTYSTNGQGIYGIDMQTGKEGKLAKYPSPEELWKMTYAQPNEWRDRFAAIPYEDKSGTHLTRYYQETATDKVLEAIADGKDRILLTLATGTGKTFIAFQIAWKLFQSRWNLTREPTRRPRILFLADRNILANQAYNSFSAFPEDSMTRIDPGTIRKKGAVPKNANLFFTIFQTFMCGPEDTEYYGEYPKDFFDFIVIDECHRGGANDEGNWRKIMEYFSPAVQLGLTATPRRQENADTYKYFGNPVYIYSLKDGINDGFLTPFKLRQISSTLDEYVYTSDDKLIEGEIETGKRYTEQDFNRVIEIQAREKKRVQDFMDEIDQSQKTLVFCSTQDHALAVRNLINQIKKVKDPNFCQRVTANDGSLGDEHLRAFQDNEKIYPTVLTTSQKLSTGVDARNVRNIVLMRPIRSMIEFKQIIGRGTRLFEGKDFFTIYDFVKAHHLFQDPEWDGEPLEPEPKDPKEDGKKPKRPKGTKELPPDDPPERPKKIKVELADGKERLIQSMAMTSYWSPDGKPMSAVEFLKSLYGDLPENLKSEANLRKIWSVPDTRKKLLDGLAEKGYGEEQMTEMQRLIDAEKSDLFDVLAYVAFAMTPMTREKRAAYAQQALKTKYSNEQRAFLDFVLGQYVDEGVRELDEEKLPPLVELKYGTFMDATKALGAIEDIRKMFLSFQPFLYQPAVAV